jgi:hypothetical protein
MKSFFSRSISRALKGALAWIVCLLLERTIFSQTVSEHPRRNPTKVLLVTALIFLGASACSVGDASVVAHSYHNSSWSVIEKKGCENGSPICAGVLEIRLAEIGRANTTRGPEATFYLESSHNSFVSMVGVKPGDIVQLNSSERICSGHLAHDRECFLTFTAVKNTKARYP